MKIGVTIFSTDLTMPPAEVAKAAEERGFYSFYLPEHTHIPKSRLTPAPTGDDELDEDYARTLDPYVALSSAAQITEKILLGTGVSVILQHHPITLAKCIATLCHLSGGRFVLGAGYGWNREEMAHHGIDYIRRREIFREWLLAMYALWGDGEDGGDDENGGGEFHGEFVDFSASWAWPKPEPRPKILLGGAGGPKLFSHIAELADGWIPIGGAGIKEKLPSLRRAMETAGRDPDSLQIVPFGVEAGSNKKQQTAAQTAEKLEYYKSIGVTEAVLRLPSAGRDKVLPALDEMAKLRQSFVE